MGRLVAVILVIAVAVGALGFYLNWWRISRTSEGDQVDITLRVDKNKIKKDTGAAVDEVKKAGHHANEEIRNLAGRETVHGKVMSVDASHHTVMVSRNNAETVAVETNESTNIKRNRETLSVNDLQPDETVTVVYRTDGGKHIAQSITVDSK